MTFCFVFYCRKKTHKLVGDVGVVPAGHSLPDGGLHESRKGGQHVDGRVNLERRKHKRNRRHGSQLQLRNPSNQPVDLYTPKSFKLVSFQPVSQSSMQKRQRQFPCYSQKTRPKERSYSISIFSKEISTDFGRLNRTFHIKGLV